jgi:PEP-CTERM motif
MRSIACAIFLTTTLLWPRPANADLITIEPDDFAAGANLTAATPGVLLWAALVTGTSANPLLLSAVYAQHSSACDDGNSFTLCYAATGSQGFSPSSNPEGTLLSWSSDRFPANCFALLNSSTFGGSPNSCGSLNAGFQALLIELSVPTTFVEIAGGWNSDYLELRALDENFNLLALPQTLTTNPREPGFATTGTVSMTSPTGSLKYVFAGSTEGGIALDRLRLTIAQVPEPSTLLLTMAGLVGLRGHLRWRTRSK